MYYFVYVYNKEKPSKQGHDIHYSFTEHITVIKCTFCTVTLYDFGFNIFRVSIIGYPNFDKHSIKQKLNRIFRIRLCSIMYHGQTPY